MCESRTTLIRRLENPGDSRAWEEFVDLYGATIFSWGKRLGLQDADAEDLTQEAFRRVVRSLPSYDRQRGRFRPWLFTIVRNEFLKWRERRGKRPQAADGRAGEELIALAASPDDPAYWNEEYERNLLKVALERLGRRLSARNYQVFWETEMENRSPQEIAQREGMTLGAVYVTRSRAMAQLRQVIQELEAEADDLV